MKPTVLNLPGYTGSGPQHWQSLWERDHPEYRRVQQRDWEYPVFNEWITTLDQAIREINGPLVLVAHSLGCITIAHWTVQYFAHQPIRAALLVAPADLATNPIAAVDQHFLPIPLTPLPFPSIVVASTNDPSLSIERAEFFAQKWQSRLVNIGQAGHINTASGFGPWPQGEALLEGLLNDS
jgi:predicted alpha/beta hydrolase family esterase